MHSFIQTLINEEKIKRIEPSKEICKSYIHKSEKALLSAKTLATIGNNEDAIALTYYSMYYSALALLFRCGIKSENHTGTILLLKQIFNRDDKELAKAKKDRVDNQYYTDFTVQEQELKEAIEKAQEYNATLKTIIDKLQEKEIEQYHEKIEQLLQEKKT